MTKSNAGQRHTDLAFAPRITLDLTSSQIQEEQSVNTDLAPEQSQTKTPWCEADLKKYELYYNASCVIILIIFWP